VAYSDPRRAVELLNDLSAGLIRNHAVQMIAAAWMQKDPREALAWVQSLPDDVEVLSPLRALFRETPSKNVQGSTTAGSESAA
jgi:hypothetical protein